MVGVEWLQNADSQRVAMEFSVVYGESVGIVVNQEDCDGVRNGEVVRFDLIFIHNSFKLS